MNPPELNILILGPPLITLKGKPIKISRKKHRAILYYLASTQKPVTRAQVCDMFWPHETEEKARKHLREALSRLRFDLLIPDVIITANDQLYLDLDKCYVDARDYFKTVYPLLSSSEMNIAGSLPDWMVIQLRYVMSLCRTFNFLQGLRVPDSPGFENWMEFSNQNYAFSRGKIIDRLIDHYISTGDFDEALLWLDKGLTADRLDFEKNFLLMNILREKGLDQQLIDYVNSLETLFKNRDEPFPDRFSDMRTKALESKKTPDYKTSRTWPLDVIGEVKFVGREAELQQLFRAYHQKGSVLLIGEAGCGKTRLLKEFFARLPYQPRLLYCQANPLSKNIAFQSLIVGLTDEIKNEEWALLSKREQEILLSFTRGNVTDSTTFNHQVQNGEWMLALQDVFNAFMKLLESTAVHRPLLFIMDDAQWLDQASIALLAFLTEQDFFSKNGLSIATLRSEESNAVLDQAIRRETRLKTLETINIHPFNKTETALFIQNVVGGKPSPVFLDRIQFKTGGNPYFLLECLRSTKLSPIDIERFSETDFCQIPSTIKALVLEKVNSFPPVYVEILQAASTIGNWFTADVLDQLVHVEKDNFLNALEEFTRSGILTVDTSIKPAGGYRFKHNLVREIIVDNLEPARKREYHLDAANAIINRRGVAPELSAIIAHHFEQAGEEFDAARFWLAAGRYARTQYSFEDTHASYNRALALISEKPFRFTEKFIHEVITELADYAYDRTDDQTCQRLYDSCLEFGSLRQSTLLIGTGWSGLGRVAVMRLQWENAIELLDKAKYHLKHADYPGESIEACSRLGILYFTLDEFEQAKNVFEEGLLINGDYSDRRYLDARVNILTQFSLLLCQMGFPKRAHNLSVLTLNDSQLVIRKSAKMQAVIANIVTLYHVGKYREAIEAGLANYKTTELLGLRWWLSLTDLALAKSYLVLGYLDKAWEYSGKVLERENDTPTDKLLDQAREIRGTIFRLMGDYIKADEYYQLAYTGGISSAQSIECRFYSGMVAYETGRAVEGIKTMDEALALSKQKKLDNISFHSGLRRALINCHKEAADLFEAKTRPLMDEMIQRGFSFTGFYSQLIPAQTAELRRDYVSAVSHYSQAASYCAVEQLPWLELEALKKVIHLSTSEDPKMDLARGRIREILEAIAINANVPPIKGMFLPAAKVTTTLSSGGVVAVGRGGRAVARWRP